MTRNRGWQKGWKRLRLQVLTRDQYRCKLCGRPGRLEVDHIVPLAQGGHPTNPNNLQAICRFCHITKTKKELGKMPSNKALKWKQFARELG